ncbi:hypothetical protein UlMin_023882 [Ulmus minor]
MLLLLVEQIYISRTTTGKDSISLAEKLERESATMSKSETWYNMIHKVHPSLRTVNEKEYEPSLVSIGPYHHGSQNLRGMEKYKVRMLHLLLVRTQKSLENYMELMRGIKEEALRYYASDIKMDDGDKFAEMMILDGCFILEFLRNMQKKRDKSVFNLNLLMPDIFRDLVLFEHQLPLSVLSKLFELTKAETETFAQLINVFVKHFCVHYIGEKEEPSLDTDKIKNSPHLLHLVYMTCKKSTTRRKPKKTNVGDIKLLIKSDNERNFQFIKSATTLEEFGVVFKKAEKGAKLRDITFTKNDGVLKIPQLMISDRTETIFRNLVAYEKYIGNSDFTDYLFFMDCLINSPKDVELLRHRGIIENMLGDDEYVSLMFNKICSYVVTEISTDSDFDELCQDINEYSARRLNKWMAKLWHQYFSSPWSSISVFAALVLLGLTTVQTMFSIISYTNPKQS